MNLQAGPALWVNVNFLQISKSSILVSDKNEQLVQMMSQDVIQTVLFPDFPTLGAQKILSFADYEADDIKETSYGKFGVKTASFLFFFTKFTITYGALFLFFFLLFSLLNFLGVQPVQVKRCGIVFSIVDFFRRFLFFNFPIRLFLETILTVLISAILDVYFFFLEKE